MQPAAATQNFIRSPLHINQPAQKNQKLLAKTFLLRIIIFMNRNYANRSPQTAILALSTLLLRRQAQ
jgi:hypothetical protein